MCALQVVWSLSKRWAWEGEVLASLRRVNQCDPSFVDTKGAADVHRA